jgi:uncharacterized protein YkwD
MKACLCPLVGFVLVGLGSLAVRAGNEPAKSKFELSAEEQQLLDLTNKERKKADLPPLRPSPLLFKVARAHSANMAKQGKLEHDLDGKTPFQRMKAAGYRYLRGGENIAMGDAKDVSLSEVVKGWMESKFHRENLLNPYYTETGLGRAVDNDGVAYYTQVFAKPLPQR